MLSFVAVIGDLIVELEGFKEYASERLNGTLVYNVPQSPASEMLLELKIIPLEGAVNNWKLIEFRRYKKPQRASMMNVGAEAAAASAIAASAVMAEMTTGAEAPLDIAVALMATNDVQSLFLELLSLIKFS